MRIFSLTPVDDVQLLDMDVDLQQSLLRPLGHGEPWQGPWAPPRVTRLKKPRKRREEFLGDFTSVAAKSNVPVLSARARAVLEPLLGTSAEWLPLDFDEASYYLLNLLNLVDALDPQQAAVRRLPDGRILAVERYAFRPEVLAAQWLFKTTSAPFDVLATEPLRERFEAAGLTGAHFQPVWDSAHAPFKALPGPQDIAARPEVFGPDGFVPGFREWWPAEWKKRPAATRPAAS